MEAAEKWDKAAADYQRTFKLGQSEYSAAMLRFWEQEGMLESGMRVLDIGCGVGKYGVCLAQRGCDVTLVDISSEMLRRASENMAGFQSPWRVFQCDFDAVSGEEPVFSGGFDFIISTMSPAVHDRETVKKMSALSRGWCFITRFAEWRQPDRDEILINLGLEPGPRMRNLRDDCASLIQAVSAAGYVPMVKYVDYAWRDLRTPEQMADYLMRAYLEGREGEPAREEIIRTAKKRCDEEGRLADAVSTKVAWIYWKVNG